jgi:hypothetical protein
MVPSFDLFKQYYVRMYKSFCQSKLCHVWNLDASHRELYDIFSIYH